MRAKACQYVHLAQGVPNLNLTSTNFACLLDMDPALKKVIFFLGLSPNTSAQAFGTKTEVENMKLQAAQAFVLLITNVCSSAGVGVVAFNKQQYRVGSTKKKEVILNSKVSENNLIGVGISTTLVLKRAFENEGNFRWFFTNVYVFDLLAFYCGSLDMYMCIHSQETPTHPA